LPSLNVQSIDERAGFRGRGDQVAVLKDVALALSAMSNTGL